MRTVVVGLCLLLLPAAPVTGEWLAIDHRADWAFDDPEAWLHEIEVTCSGPQFVESKRDEDGTARFHTLIRRDAAECLAQTEEALGGKPNVRAPGFAEAPTAHLMDVVALPIATNVTPSVLEACSNVERFLADQVRFQRTCSPSSSATSKNVDLQQTRLLVAAIILIAREQSRHEPMQALRTLVNAMRLTRDLRTGHADREWRTVARESHELLVATAIAVVEQMRPYEAYEFGRLVEQTRLLVDESPLNQTFLGDARAQLRMAESQPSPEVWRLLVRDFHEKVVRELPSGIDDRNDIAAVATMMRLARLDVQPLPITPALYTGPLMPAYEDTMEAFENDRMLFVEDLQAEIRTRYLQRGFAALIAQRAYNNCQQESPNVQRLGIRMESTNGDRVTFHASVSAFPFWRAANIRPLMSFQCSEYEPPRRRRRHHHRPHVFRQIPVDGTSASAPSGRGRATRR